MDRAYSVLTVKTVSDGERRISGIATSPTTDRMGDIVESAGVRFKNPAPLLWMHQSDKPVGWVRFGKATKDGIPFEAEIARIDEPGALQDRVNEAWQSVKARLVTAVSIGFRTLNNAVEVIKGGGLRFLETEVMELSLVVIPANPDATITQIKQFDLESLAASGHKAKPVVRLTTPPGASGKTNPETPRGKPMATYQEQIASFEAKRAANVGRQDEILKAAADEGRTFNDAEKEEYGNLDTETKSVDEHLTILRSAADRVVATAKAVPAAAGTNPEVASRTRVGDGVIKTNANLPKGMGLARMAKALAFARINMVNPVDYAKQQWGDSQPEVAEMLQKTAIGAGTSTDSTWASPLVYANNLASEFVDYLRPQTILGKIANVRRVPFNVRYPIQNGGSTVGWVGQGAPKPVSKLSFTSASLGFAKAAGIVVITQELARFSSPAAELVVRDDMAAQMIYFLDQQFIDPSVVAVSNVSPASVLNGASNVRQAAATWTTMANVLTDVKVFLTTFATNEISLDGSYWIMTPDMALSLSLLLNTGGTGLAFPDVSINGGTFLGIPVIVSNSVPHSVSAGSVVALVKGSEIFLADDGGINISVSGEASLNMDSAPTNNSATPTATSVVSMFQTDSIAIRAERYVNWGVRRAYGVGYVDNAHTS